MKFYYETGVSEIILEKILNMIKNKDFNVGKCLANGLQKVLH